MKFHAEEIPGGNLMPGDLFSSAGAEYWDHAGEGTVIAEKVYVRTENPASPVVDAEVVWRITFEGSPEFWRLRALLAVTPQPLEEVLTLLADTGEGALGGVGPDDERAQLQWAINNARVMADLLSDA